MRQKLVWGRTDIRVPREFVHAVRYPDPEKVADYLKADSSLAQAENLLALACRVPEVEGHGGHIPEDSKQQSDRIKVVTLFLTHGCDPNIRNRRKVTPLHACCRFDLPLVAEILLQNKADPNAYDEVRETPLYRAVNLGYVECVKVLLKFKVDLDFQNRKGSTVLHRAVMRGKRDVVPILIDGGARLDIRDRQGKLPLEYARGQVKSRHLDRLSP